MFDEMLVNGQIFNLFNLATNKAYIRPDMLAVVNNKQEPNSFLIVIQSKWFVDFQLFNIDLLPLHILEIWVFNTGVDLRFNQTDQFVFKFRLFKSQ